MVGAVVPSGIMVLASAPAILASVVFFGCSMVVWMCLYEESRSMGETVVDMDAGCRASS